MLLISLPCAGIPVSISVADGNVMVGGANVTATDIEASNGVIHVVDAVILPPAEDDAMMEEETMAEPMAEMDIVDTAVAAGTFNTLAQLLTDAGLVETLKGEGPFTVFAPTDDAFAAVPAETLEALAADNEQLVKVLTYHVVPGKVMAADVVNLSSADTVAGVPVAISVTDAGGVMVDNANVTATDIEASNGVIHVIDAVIIPAEDNAMMEEEMMAEGESVASCTDYTVQADDWLSKIAEKSLGDVLAYPQIVDATNAAAAESSKYGMIDNPDVIEVGQVVCIPSTEGAMMEEETMEEPMAEMDIVDTAVAAGTFNTLAQLLTDAGLVETLKGEGPFTVFAPTDDAFAAVPAETLEALAADPEELVKVLTYHVVPGKLMAADVVNHSSADTVAGIPVDISVTDGNVMVGGANVTATDIEASNGVIHVVDAVILPPAEGEAMMEEEMMEEPMAEMDIVDTAVAAGTFNTLAQLLTDAGLVETLKGEGPFTVFAPTDDAFAAVPAETLEALAADNEQLVKVLTYHVVPGKVMAADVVNLSSADTVAGVPVAISVTDAGGVMVDNANVTATDIEASNGVIHVIDAVIIPAE
jgi:transforming growth factor-beta-induced protein